ncbi:MAG: restriction endonuclease subunit M, partial [Lentisphaerae bacterium]|nr:restriction endonuclease subunit M [Lentisphaerota bacterium]
RERINAFDWQDAFAAVFRDGGFDCVIGNPPYVKLQHFRRYQPDVAEYLMTANLPDGSPLYESTRTGNFDLYLPFIEKGVELLKPDGRMGFIAPNVWMVNEYGRALRTKIRRTGRLDRWLDFKSFQVFDEAITYTALQFFRGRPVNAIACAFAPDGNIEKIDWAVVDAAPYESLPDDGAWNLLTTAERALLDKLSNSCTQLKSCCQSIIVGIQTSADAVYHLARIAPGRYRTRTDDEVLIEDGLMRPLMSGAETKRYQAPQTATWLLFPYLLAATGPRLFTAAEMAERFPNGWAYLRKHEADLRGREHGGFDDDQWYRFGRNQNLDKQELPKLCVAETVPSLRVCYDAAGAFFLNNVRVNGVLPTESRDGWFLLGILNAPVCDFVFRRTAKPKDGGWYEANKQFIAPLPIPAATSEEQQQVGGMAMRLQELHTKRRDLVAKLAQRLQSGQTMAMSPAPGADWLWAEVRTPAAWKAHADAPAALKGRELTAWAKARYEDALNAQLYQLDGLLQPGARLDVENTADDIRVTVNGSEALRVYDKPDTPFIAAQWRHALRDVTVTDAFNGKRLLRLLLNVRVTADHALRDRIVAIDADIAALDAKIAAAEQAINAVVYRLYQLTPEEIAMIEAGADT